MLHTKSFNECQKPHGNNKINLIHFYPELWVSGNSQKLHLTMSFHNYSHVGQVSSLAHNWNNGIIPCGLLKKLTQKTK